MDDTATQTVIQDKQELKMNFFRLGFLRCPDYVGFKQKEHVLSVIEGILNDRKKPKKTIFSLNLE